MFDQNHPGDMRPEVSLFFEDVQNAVTPEHLSNQRLGYTGLLSDHVYKGGKDIPNSRVGGANKVELA